MDYAAVLRDVTQPKGKVPVLKAGQTVRVHSLIIEGNKERIQVFEGLVIGVKGSGVNKTFTVRKTSFGVGVERTWPVFSPKIKKIEVVKQSKVRRAKLNFIRGLTKKQSRLREKFGEVSMEGAEEEVAEETKVETSPEGEIPEAKEEATQERKDEPVKEEPQEEAETKEPESPNKEEDPKDKKEEKQVDPAGDKEVEEKAKEE